MKFHVTIPANRTSARLSYRLTLYAKRHGVASAHITVTTTPKAKPAVVTQVSVGYQHTCALISNGHVYCWGADQFGEIGNGTEHVNAVTKPVEVSGLDDATQVAGGLDDTCALLATGHVDCWGMNRYAQTGDETESEVVSTPTPVKGIEHATHVAVGWEFACALLTEGHVKCWGDNAFGSIGAGIEPLKQTVFKQPESAKSNT